LFLGTTSIPLSTDFERMSSAKRSQAISPLVLAKAGFYRIEDPEYFHTVRCAYCRIEMANLQPDHPSPVITHKKRSPTCPMVIGTAEERDGISFIMKRKAQKQEPLSDGNDDHEIDEASAQKNVVPEQEDLAAMADLSRAAEASTAQQARGPSSKVRARVYRELERLAEITVEANRTQHPVPRINSSHGLEVIKVEDSARKSRRGATQTKGVAARVKPASRRKLSFADIQKIFSTLDKNGDGSITNAEFIVGLKKHPWLARAFGSTGFCVYACSCLCPFCNPFLPV
jgi:hypothetical protein